MAVFPEYYKVDRGELTNPDYAGEYDTPLVTKEDYDDLLNQSHQARQNKIAKGEDNYKKLNQVKQQHKPGMIFSSPNLQKRFQDLQESLGINDAAYSAVLNGDPYVMRKLESAYASLSNNAEYWNLYKEDQYYNNFKKEADKIKDPNMKSQAYAAMAAYETGEPDPATGEVLTAYDLNPGHYATLDLEKDIDGGLKNLMVTEEVVEDKGGYQQTVKQSRLDNEKAKQWFEVYMSNPAVQRNLISKGLGLIGKDESGKKDFQLNENGQAWMNNILGSKITPIRDVQGIKFNTKVYNESGSKSGGFILDDIAKSSTTTDQVIEKQGDQNVRVDKITFDQDLFYKQLNIKMKDPVFRQKMLDQGFIDDAGNFTESVNTALDVYFKKLNKKEIKGHKNAPQPKTGSGKGRGGGAKKETPIEYPHEKALKKKPMTAKDL